MAGKRVKVGERPRAIVIFDLFGTLVPQFPRVEHDRMLEACSHIAGVDPDICCRSWRDLYSARVRGHVSGIAGHLAHVANEQNVSVERERLEEACRAYRSFVRDMLVPTEDAGEALESLESIGAVLGLLSNAHDDVADAFARSELSRYFTATVFSCRVGYQKPDPRAFAAVLAALGCSASDGVTFVGDGSDEEMSGASAAGMRAILLRADLTNAYDGVRPAVEAWTGEWIDKLCDLPQLIAAGRASTSAEPDERA